MTAHKWRKRDTPNHDVIDVNDLTFVVVTRPNDARANRVLAMILATAPDHTPIE